jgi:hypothetical protein
MKSTIIIGALALLGSEPTKAISIDKMSAGIFSSMVELENADETIKEEKKRRKLER